MKPISNFHEDCITLTSGNRDTGSIDILPLLHQSKEDGHMVGRVMVSCWKVTFKDLLRMLFTRRLWLVVMGERWPPLFIESDKQYTGVDEWTKMQKEEGKL